MTNGTAGGSPESRAFPPGFDQHLRVGPERNSAYFGLDVLRGLVDGIDEFVHEPQDRWRQYRSDGTVLLGSSMWINDATLIDQLGALDAACIVVSKQGRKPGEIRKLEPLVDLNQRTPGIPTQHFTALTELAPTVNGKPQVIGPYGRPYDGSIPTIRTLGFRKSVGRGGGMPPIIHAKIALLGHLWWHDEGPLGHVEDVRGFTPHRLWVSSANFTSSSRSNLEMGYWTEDPDLMRGAERFLCELMAASEAVDPASDGFQPDLARVEYDDDAMWQAMEDLRGAYDDDHDDGYPPI